MNFSRCNALRVLDLPVEGCRPYPHPSSARKIFISYDLRHFRYGSWLRDNALTRAENLYDPVSVVRHNRSEQRGGGPRTRASRLAIHTALLFGDLLSVPC